MPQADYQRVVSTIRFLVYSMILALSACLSAKAELISPESQTLQFSSVLPHEGNASLVLISSDGQIGYIIENNPKAGTATLFSLSPQLASLASQTNIEHLVTAVALDPKNGGRVFLGGDAGDNRAVTVASADGKETASYVTFAGKGAMTLAPDHKGGLYVGDSASGSVLRIDQTEFAGFAVALAARNKRKAEVNVFLVPGISGINSMAVSKDDAILFVSDAARPQIVSVSLEKPGAELSRIGTKFSKEGDLPPLSFALASRPSRRVKSGEVSSLYIADPQQRRLQLVDYNEVASTFSGIAETLLSPVSASETAQQASADPSGILIGVDNAQSTILIGTGRQASLDLFSRSGSTLQQLVTVGLPDRPEGISLSADGRRALVLLRGGKVALLDSDPAVQPTRPIDNKTIGNDTIRDIQYTLDRLGFRVGAIDGIAGSRTGAAARDAIAKMGLDPALSLKEPEKLLEALKSQLDRMKSAN
jgi:hypothetical protein